MPKRAGRYLYEFGDVKLLAPIPRPGNIFCCDLDDRSHVEENPAAVFLEAPGFFVQASSAVIGPDEPIRWPGERFQVDYKVELAVVVGKTGRRLTLKNAVEHIFGYTIPHDLSSRWVQFKDKNEDMGKNCDFFAPMGPCIVTADEITDPSQLRLSLKLNGEVMQDRTNEDGCFSRARLLEWFTVGITLEPVDAVTTGTSAGIGYFRKPRIFLKPGDVCELEISGIGELVNRVVADEFRFPTRRPAKRAA